MTDSDPKKNWLSNVMGNLKGNRKVKSVDFGVDKKKPVSNSEEAQSQVSSRPSMLNDIAPPRKNSENQTAEDSQQEQEFDPDEYEDEDQDGFGYDVDQPQKDKSVGSFSLADQQKQQMESEQLGKTDGPQTGGQDSADKNASPLEKASAKPEKSPGLQKSTKETPPGGKAISGSSKASKVASQVGGKAGEAANKVESAKNMAVMATNAARALAGDVTAAGKLALDLLKNKKTRKIIIIIIVLTLFTTAAAIAVPLSMISGTQGSPNAFGKSPQQPASPVDDFDLFRQVLRLSGEQLVSNQNLDTQIDTIMQKLMKLKEDVTAGSDSNKADILAKIDVTMTSLTTLKGTKTKENATNFLSKLKELSSVFENNIPNYSGSTRIPTTATTLSFNNTLHGGSVQRPEHVDSHGVYGINPYNVYDKGTCDAIDISGDQGAPVYPIFGGKIIEVGDDAHGGQVVAVKDGDYAALYAHLLDVSVHEGDTVDNTKALGSIKINHVHMEVMYKDQCVTTTDADVIDYKSSTKKHDQWGAYMWDHIVSIFNISS